MSAAGCKSEKRLLSWVRQRREEVAAIEMRLRSGELLAPGLRADLWAKLDAIEAEIAAEVGAFLREEAAAKGEALE